MAIFYVYKKRILGMMLLLCLCICSWRLGSEAVKVENVSAQEHLNMYAGSYALMDGDTGRVLKGKNDTDPMANASTTKILTCIVTLENALLEDMVTISANAASQPKVRYGMKEGEQYVLRDLLYGLMLESYNDCAVAIAEHVAGSQKKFASLLNKKAKEIGCKDTYFVTPNGLDAEDEEGFHHSTAEDLCKIMAYCVWESPEKEMFLQITQTRNYGDFVNRNSFLDQMEGVVSGKTGYTAKAGYCYVAALEQDGERYTIALLACGWPNNKNYKWYDAKTLFTYALENYEQKEVVFKSVKEYLEVDGYTDAPSFGGLNQKSKILFEAEERTYTVLMSVKERLRIEKRICENVELPVEEGMVLGEYHVYLGNVKLDVIPLVATNNGGEWTYENVLKVILFQFLSLTS